VLSTLTFRFQYPIYGFTQRLHSRIRRNRGATLFVITIDPNCLAPCGDARIDISPAIADHVAAIHVHTILFGAPQQQSHFRLTAIAGVVIGVKARIHVIKREFVSQNAMNLLDSFGCLRPTSDIRLVRHDQQKKTCGLQTIERRTRIRDNAHFRRCRRRIRLALAYNGFVENPVSIKKYRARRAASAP
jgi:hypothetical protein